MKKILLHFIVQLELDENKSNVGQEQDYSFLKSYFYIKRRHVLNVHFSQCRGIPESRFKNDSNIEYSYITFDFTCIPLNLKRKMSVE